MKAFWNILFSLFFIALMVASVLWLSGRGQLPAMIPPYLLVLMALATFRLVRLFTYDHITAFLRDWFAWGKEGTFLGTVRELLGCPWCNGLWFAALVLIGWCAFPAYAMPVILLLAIAALASVFQVAANLLGWHAEGKKQEVKGR